MIEFLEKVLAAVGSWLIDLIKGNLYVVVLGIAGLVRAMGKVVKTGTTGLLFKYGRARKIVNPGFQYLIPFLWKVTVLPTRSRTIDLPAQRVTTFDSLVYEVDVNLVFRIVDITKALIEVDDLDEGMLQMLGLSVQEVLRVRQREDLHVSEDLDAALAEAMTPRLEPWGVVVERAGFTSIRPSPMTLRLTQLAHRIEERRTSLGRLDRAGIPRGLALPMLGTPRVFRRRFVNAFARELEGARQRRVRRTVGRVIDRKELRDQRKRIRLANRAKLLLGAGVVHRPPSKDDEQAATRSEAN